MSYTNVILYLLGATMTGGLVKLEHETNQEELTYLILFVYMSMWPFVALVFLIRIVNQMFLSWFK